MKKLIYIAAMFFTVAACDLYESPISDVAKDNLFASENGLKMYTMSFYDVLPGGSITTWGDTYNNYMNAFMGVREFYTDSYGPERQEKWSWTTLRNINYFLDNNTNEAVDQKVRDNYSGIAKFWRAYFYFHKIREYGDVPWIDHTLDIDDELLQAGRDPRNTVAEKIYEDLQFAIEHITETTNSTGTTVTNLVAAGMQSRFCLWEGTFRKYHGEADANKWLERAAAAAKIVMDSKKFSIYTSGSQPYRELFVTTKPITQEVMLASVFSKSENITNSMNRKSTVSTLGNTASPSRQFMNLFLKLDGTPYTDDPSYATDEFMHEFDGRDKRVGQIIRTPGYKRTKGKDLVAACPDWLVTYTGYMGMKFCTDDEGLDASNNTGENNYVFMRYAEILINYAEAKAELGTLTDAEWAQTIGAIRARAGITGGLTAKPTKVDTYLQKTWFPKISDPVILEARRERMIELVWEDCPNAHGDLQRWAIGEAYGMRWQGIYVKEFNKNIDLDLDGTPDVFFYTDPSKKPDAEGHVAYIYVPLTPVKTEHWSVDTDGHTILFDMVSDPVQWKDKYYFHPMSVNDIALNPNLQQTVGW